MKVGALFSGICLACDLPSHDQRDLCEYCALALPWNQHACPHCAHPKPQDFSLCPDCHRAPSQSVQSHHPEWAFQQVVVPLVFADPVRHWVHQLKFKQSPVAGRLLGLLLAEQLATTYEHAELPDLLIPIPLHWRRRLQRGLNQSQVISQYLLRELKRARKNSGAVPALQTSYLRRTRHLPSQQTLGRAAREDNLTGAFTCKSLQGQSVALVDDVLTTGATVRAAALACTQAGASGIHIWCVARTPRPATLDACQTQNRHPLPTSPTQG